LSAVGSVAGKVGTCWAGLVGTIAEPESEAIVLAQAQSISTRAAEVSGLRNHVVDTGLSALRQAGEGDLSGTNADQSSCDNEGLHG